jgi:hypothetical protein
MTDIFPKFARSAIRTEVFSESLPVTLYGPTERNRIVLIDTSRCTFNLNFLNRFVFLFESLAHIIALISSAEFDLYKNFDRLLSSSNSLVFLNFEKIIIYDFIFLVIKRSSSNSKKRLNYLQERAKNRGL